MPPTTHPAADGIPPLPFTACVVSTDTHTRTRLAELLQHPDGKVYRLDSFALDHALDDRLPDLLVLDAAADDGVSSDVLADALRQARRRWPSAGLVCMNVDTNEEAVALLQNGADDALLSTAPWELVTAQVAAALRRAQVANAQLRIAFGDLVYDRESRRVWCAGREVGLTPRELRLFDILFLRAGAPVSVDTLQDYVWHDDTAPSSNSLAVYVGYLRRKLMGSRAAVLETLRGKGYRLSRK